MQDLIKIENTPLGPSLRDTPSGPSLRDTTIGDESVPTVNARELYEFLESKQRFADWIKKRIEKYEFVENQDYIRLHKKMKANNATMVEYYISLDMAKELSMIESNNKGKEARKYFIECEKKLHKIVSTKQNFLLNIISAEDDLSRAVAMNEYELGYVKPLEQFKEQALPKVDFFDTVTASEKLIDIGESSKVLLFKGLGRNNLFKVLKGLEILDKNNVPYQKYVSRGYFKLIETTVNGKPYIKTAVYQKGLDFLNKILANAGYEKEPHLEMLLWNISPLSKRRNYELRSRREKTITYYKPLKKAKELLRRGAKTARSP